MTSEERVMQCIRNIVFHKRFRNDCFFRLLSYSALFCRRLTLQMLTIVAAGHCYQSMLTEFKVTTVHLLHDCKKHG